MSFAIHRTGVYVNPLDIQTILNRQGDGHMDPFTLAQFSDIQVPVKLKNDPMEPNYHVYELQPLLRYMLLNKAGQISHPLYRSDTGQETKVFSFDDIEPIEYEGRPNNAQIVTDMIQQAKTWYHFLTHYGADPANVHLDLPPVLPSALVYHPWMGSGAFNNMLMEDTAPFEALFPQAVYREEPDEDLYGRGGVDGIGLDTDMQL